MKQYRSNARPKTLALLALLGFLASCSLNGGPLPVIFVHGLGGEIGSSFSAMRAWMDDNGYHPAMLREIKLSNSYGNCIETSAKELKAEVDRFVLQTGAPKIDLVGHSFGGLVARYYVKNLGGDKKVRSVVTLASPHHGTALSRLNPWFCSVSQMAVDSPFLKALNSVDETPGAGVLWTSFRNDKDVWVIPQTSPILAGGRNEALPEDHVTMLTSKNAFAKVKDALEGGGLNTR